MHALPDKDDVLSLDTPHFLTDVKNPCFALTDDKVNVGSITISTALEEGYNIQCLPYVFLAG